MPKVLEWMDWYHELEKYYEEHGNVDVPYKYETEKGLRLGSWLNNQRSVYKGNGTCNITEDQTQLLNNLGMKWEVQKENWNKSYYALEEYYKKYGNIDVPTRYETKDGIKLGSWLSHQRQAYKGKGTCKITENQIQLLNDLGMKWEAIKENWNDNYYVLEKYYEEHGNVDVPQKYETEEGLKLGQWMYTQRRAYKGNDQHRITNIQIKLLNNLNMEWSIYDTKVLNMKLKKGNKDKYYRVLNDRLDHVLTDISYEISNEITEENQGELCKQIVKRMWR